MTNIRRATAEHLSHAWDAIPHVTQFDKADITPMEELRSKFRKQVEQVGGNLTVTAVLAKFIIVSVLVLGAAAFTSPGGGGPFDSQAPPGGTLLVGMLLVGLAAMSPVALLWALPTFETAVLAQFHGSARAPLSAVPHTVERSVYHLGLQRMWRERSRHGGGGAGQLMVFQPGTTVIV